MKEIIKKHGLSALFVVLLVLFVYFKTWWGVGGLITFISILQIVRVVVFFKSMPWIKNLMLIQIKKWESAQLGYDLDDPYWDNHTRPSLLQKLRGVNPNQDIKENKRRKQINKDIVKSMSVKDKYFSMFDYHLASKGIFLVVSISLAILLISLGINILLVFALILLLGWVKKKIDSKFLAIK